MTAVTSATTKAICPDFPTLFRAASPGKLAYALEAAQTEQDRRVQNIKNTSLCPLAQLLTTVTDDDLFTIAHAAKTEKIRRDHPQAAEIETWMETLLTTQKIAALVLDYVTSNNDLWAVQDVANWYHDHSWLRAFEAAKNSPSILVKNHELALHAKRINEKVNYAVHLDKVELKGVKLTETTRLGYSYPVQLSAKTFYLVSNRLEEPDACITRLHEATGETQFWLLLRDTRDVRDTTISIIINKPPTNVGSISDDPAVFSIDSTKMTLLVGSDPIHRRRMVSDWPYPLQGSFHVIKDMPNSSSILRIRNPVINGVSDAVRKYWQDTGQPGAWS